MSAVQARQPKPTASPAPAGRALRLHQAAPNIESVSFALEPIAVRRGSEAVVEIRGAAVNPSDAKAAIGMMPYAVWPRTPGRDFAGIVLDGPADLVGREVWGTGGELGIRRDGSHATHLVVGAESLCPKPATISLIEAAGVGVPFITAWEGFVRAGLPKPGETVAVMGANGKVGQAAIQIATMQGARAIGVVRRAEPYRGHASGPVEMVDASATDVAAAIRDLTDGRGADIVYNTVGSPYFEAAHKALALLGRQILIATIDKVVPFNIFEFYRGRHTYVGVDTLALDSATCARMLEALAPAFEQGALKPFPVRPDAIFPLARAGEAYRAVLDGAQHRIVLDPTA